MIEDETRFDRPTFPMASTLGSFNGAIIPVEPNFDDGQKEEFLQMFARYFKANVKLTDADLRAFQEGNAFEWLHEDLLPDGHWGAPDVALGPDAWIDDFRHLPNRVKVYFAPAALRYAWFPYPELRLVDLEDVLGLVNFGVNIGMVPHGVFVWLQPIHRRSEWPV